MISTFGCNNGLILAGARAYYAMARDGLFFRASGRLNAAKVPALGPACLQGVWAAFLVLPRTYDPATQHVRQSLQQPARLRDLGGADLLHPDDRRRLPPARDAARRRAAVPRVRLSVVPALYIVGAATILLVLFVYRTATTWPGLVIVLLGVPVYFPGSRSRGAAVSPGASGSAALRRARTWTPVRVVLTSISCRSRVFDDGGQ